MLGAFWEAVGGKLADRWAAVAAPALIFWLGGLAAWTYYRGGLHTLDDQARWLDQQATVTQVAVILTALVVVVASGAAVTRLTRPALRLLEGYWPGWTGPLANRLAYRAADRADKERTALHQARTRLRTRPTPADRATVARLERRRHRRPVARADYLPTPLGNLLRAAETRPAHRYGLDTVIVWPRLWLVLPDSTRHELLAARTSLDTAVATSLWALLSCAFTPLAWPALPVGLTLAAATITIAVPARAQTFGDLIEAAYDIHRTALYQHLRLPLPASPQDEPAAGRALTTLLWRGTHDPTLTYTPPPSPEP